MAHAFSAIVKKIAVAVGQNRRLIFAWRERADEIPLSLR
jgi:hypothetical protein